MPRSTYDTYRPPPSVGATKTHTQKPPRFSAVRPCPILPRELPAYGGIVAQEARRLAKEVLVLMPFIRLAIEANEVIALRFMKIISGGPDAMAEIQLMITEKINASAEAGTSLIFGKSPTVVVARVCEHVANNQRRLSARP
jgi:hypothetical protein